MTKINIKESVEIVKKLKKIMSKQDNRAFNRRKSGIDQKTFLLIFTTYACSTIKPTLEGLALKCQEIQNGLSFTKQALLKRLPQGRKALENLLGDVISQNITYKTINKKSAVVFEQFSSVDVTDATTVSLPDKLARCHLGLGGTNSKSALKIQATYDVKNKELKKVSIRSSARENDASYMEEIIEMAEPGSLTITDLGYYSVSGFQKIATKGAYFISKIKSNTVIYNENGEIINLTQVLKCKDFVDMQVSIRGDCRKISMSLRLCGLKLPQKAYAKRLRNANKAAKQKNKRLSKEKKERLKWILVITNVPQDMLCCEAVCEVYRIRWQIEIIFKAWKSHFSIDKFNTIGKNYLDCLLYGKLIAITVLTSMHSRLHTAVCNADGNGVSIYRFMKNMVANMGIILCYLVQISTLYEVESYIYRITRASLIEKRNRLTSEQSISSFDVPADSSFCFVS